MKDKIKVYMCDDDKEYLSYAQKEVIKIAGPERKLNFTIFNNGEEMIEQCKKDCADVLFLDIDMPGMDGFKVAETIQEFYHDVLIIFLTAHDEMVFQSFNYHPFWFVRKSLIKELEIVIPSLFEKLDSIYDGLNTEKSIVVNNDVYKVDVKTLKMISSYRHHVFLMDEKRGEIKIRAKLHIIEEQLADCFFTKVQKGIILNLRFVCNITSRKVILKDGSEINIGRDRLESVRLEYHKYLRSI